MGGGGRRSRVEQEERSQRLVESPRPECHPHIKKSRKNKAHAKYAHGILTVYVLILRPPASDL
jgi:hypothetical protein